MLDLALLPRVTIISQFSACKAISGGNFEDSGEIYLYDNAQGEIFGHITCSQGEIPNVGFLLPLGTNIPDKNITRTLTR